MSDTDMELLARYTRQHSSRRNPMEADAEDDFAELVRRHLGLVYAAALRQVRSPQLAEEVAQSVFTDLARSAARLKPDTILTAWLYQVTRRTAIDVVRREASRQLREQIATEMNATNATDSSRRNPMEADADWIDIEPLLDEAMHALDDTDRTAVLLRYFENKSLREVGITLGTSENAAQKRLGRAVERLRKFFAKRGVTVGASGLVVVISANAVQAAPVGLAVTISTAAALAGTTLVATTATAIATKAIVMTTFQKTILGVTLAAAIGTGIYEVRQVSRLRGEVQTLQQQRAIFIAENGRLLREREQAANRLAALADDMARAKALPTELLRLRGEVSRLGAELRQSPLTRIASLKQKLEQMPDKRIPELQFLTEKDWAMAAWDADLETNDGVRKALGALRERAVDRFLEMMMPAMQKYLAANGGVLPPHLLALQRYFDIPVSEEVLQRYKLLQGGKPNPEADLVVLAAHVDDEYDSHHRMSLNESRGEPFNQLAEAIKFAAVEFANDNNGQLPSAPGQLTAYLKQPVDAATIQKYLKDVVVDPPPPELRTLTPALKVYTEANGGKQPESPFDLVPYLSTSEQQAAFLRLVQMPPEAAALMPALKAYAENNNRRVPKNAADLRPYLTTPEQEAALKRLEQWRMPEFK